MAIFCGQIQKVELMVSKGVDIEEKSNFGRTPLDFAIYHKDIFEFLILKGAKNPKGLSPLTPEEIESEIEEARRELNDALGIGIDCSNGDSDC
jgi:ankyrin repeat protein